MKGRQYLIFENFLNLAAQLQVLELREHMAARVV